MALTAATTFQTLTVHFTFATEFSSTQLDATGFEDIAQAEAWGHAQASRLSAESGIPHYLSTVVANSRNFVCLPVSPDYFAGIQRLGGRA